MTKDQLARYKQMVADGTSESLAEMFAMQQPPGAISDTTFLAGRANGEQFKNNPRTGAKYRAMASRAGVSTQGKYYMSQLANYPGDPQAWVGTRGDIRATCERNGWSCSGRVKYKAPGHDNWKKPKIPPKTKPDMEAWRRVAELYTKEEGGKSD